MRKFLPMLAATGLLLLCSSVWAMRSKKPPTFSDLKDTNQLTELNQTLEDFWQILNGRYTLENLITDPNGTRKGQKGDLVYATFGSNDHLCVNTSFPAGMTWTCINVGTLSTCPGGADGMVQFNDNGTCGGDAQFLWEKNLNILTVIGSAGFGSVTTPGGTVEIDPADTTLATAEDIELLASSQTITVNSGSTIANQRQNQFLAPVINGVAGGATETVTDAATVYIDQAPSGSNITLTTTADLMFGEGTTTSVNIQVQDETTANTAGRDLTLNGANGLGSGAGGDIFLQAGAAGATGNGGEVSLTATDAGSTSGTGGDINITAGNGVGTNKRGGDVFIQPGKNTGTGNGGIIDLTRQNQTGLTSSTSNKSLFTNDILIDALADGTTQARYTIYDFEPPALRGVVGGGTETFTQASTVFISGSPVQDTNVTVNDTAALVVSGLTNGSDVTNGSAHTLFDGQTRAFQANAQFYAPTINGVAGGGTETVTNAATLYIDAAPSGSNITFTNGPYALWVDAGKAQFDGIVQLGQNTVSGQLVIYDEAGVTDYTTTFQPSTQTQNVTYTLPPNDGTSGQVLQTDGVGVLTWSSSVGGLTLAAGQWSPTTNDIANLDSSSAAEGQYLRIGATVSGSVQITVNPTLTATSTQTELDLPVASNFGATSDASGSCAAPGIASMSVAITADTGSDELEVRWIATDVTSQEIDCSFAYQVI